ncbi:DUF6266 family protein [Pedobacter sp.]|uniref:DUF6266 family protein n=1 Tax=Pedobacter sp. TaxID=1411316 RepID=UPI0031D0BA6F
MGKIEQGILGAFSGTVGTVVGARWRGIRYMRGKGPSTRPTSTVKQDKQRERFLLMVHFVRAMSPIITLGYKKLAVNMTPANAALSYNLKNGVTGTYPDFEIAYDMVLLSRGDLPNASNVAAVAEGGSTVKFTWLNNAGSGKALESDLCMAAAYCEELDLAICSILNPADTRQKQLFNLNVSDFAGRSVETYLTFFSADGKEIANSLYTGNVPLP